MDALKKLLAGLTPSKVLKGLAWALTSLYLTACVDLYILDSVWLRLPVFVCFFALCAALSLAAARRFKPVPRAGTVLLAVLSAVMILVGCRDIFFPPKQKLYLTLTAETAGEICLCDVVVDGENIPINHARVVENSGWLYREEYDNFVIWPEEDGVENRLTLRFAAAEVRLGFPYTPYAGSVAIESSAGGGGTWDLSCPERAEGEAVEYADFPFDCRRVYSPLELLLYGPGAVLMLSFLCFFFPYAIGLAWRRSRVRAEMSLLVENEQGLIHQDEECLPYRGGRGALTLLLSPEFGGKLVFLAVLLAMRHWLFFTSRKIAPGWCTAAFLTLLTAMCYFCLTSDLAHCLLEKYRTPGKIALVSAVALYASFASFGQRFFLDGNTRMHGSAEGLLYVALGTVWFIPVIWLLLLGLEWLASPRKAGSRPAYPRLAFYALLAILCLCQAVVLWNFWPGGFPSDSIDLIRQAAGYTRIKDWHPAINAILYHFVLDICPHAGALVAVQLFFFALICAKFLALGYDYGVPFKTLAILGIVFSLLPNQVMFGIAPLKDYPYTLSLLWGTYLLVRLAINPEELRRWQFLVAMPLALFLIYAFRHNGVVPFAVLLLLFAWITIRHFPQVKFRLAAVSLSSILLIAVYKGPVFSWFRVSQDPAMSPYTTMLCAVASCINKGLPLSEEGTAIMESVLPLDQWGDYYDRYMGHDPYYWGRGELAEEYPFDPAKVTTGEAFAVYLEALRKYPDVVIKDRLDGMDLLWDVRQPEDGFNTKGFCCVVISEEDQVVEYFDFGPMEPGEEYYNDSSMLDTYRGTMDTAANSVLDMILWRSGAYLILLMTLGVFWWGNRMKRLLWAAVPLLGQIAGLVLVLYHQSYRYISAVQLLTLALVFCSIFLRSAGAGGGPWREPPAGPGADGGAAHG